jgi:hypothetical protein
MRHRLSYLALGAALVSAACGADSSQQSDGSQTAGVPPTLDTCPVFPADNAWNRDVSAARVDPRSDAYIAHMNGGRAFLHADFGGDSTYGIPWTTVAGSQARVPVTFDYADESDPGPYPIPRDAPVEAGSDHHVIVIDRDNCMLYETWDSTYVGPGWRCGSGAIFNLRSNALRPAGWTSADAAGLPIFPGLARRAEVQAGAIRHALRFTVERTQRAYVAPARHFASSSRDPDDPPMGLRVRLKASYDLSRFRGAARVVLETLRTYGMILADNGGDWFISGETNTQWDDEDLNQLKTVPGNAFEAIETGPLTTG